MTECNAIIEANNEIDELKRENKELNELCVKYGFEVGRLEEENKQLKEQLEICKELIEENKMLKNNVEKLSEDVRFLAKLDDYNYKKTYTKEIYHD